jgi:hypothetical protein
MLAMIILKECTESLTAFGTTFLVHLHTTRLARIALSVGGILTHSMSVLSIHSRFFSALISHAIHLGSSPSARQYVSTIY